ncbi:MAG: hypothetical protein CMD09_03190 [Flavobacteriales bacterium]|nr:hypothetical protein [Flavobacteriales bacterium]
MAFTVKNRIKQTSTTNGTTNVVMTGSVSGFQTFGNALSDGDTTYYAIVDPANGTWEVGLGTWANGSSTLTRTTILESSSGSSAIDFSGSVSKDVFVTEPASKSLIEGSSAISNAEFLKKNGNVIEGRSASEVRSDLGLGSLALLSQVAQPSMALNTVNEAILQVSNTPTNNYFLQAQSGNTGGLTWAEVDLSSYLTSSTASSTYAPLSGASFSGAMSVNSGTTNTVATFTSTDSVAGIQLIDSSGVSEITTEGTTFQVRPNGGVAKLSVGTSGATFADHVSLPDSKEIKVGTGDDLKLYHDGNNSYIKNTTGWLNMPLGGNGLSIANSDYSEMIAQFNVNGQIKFWHDNSPFLTSNAGSITLSNSNDTDDALIFLGANNRANLYSVDGSYVTLKSSGSSGNDDVVSGTVDSYTYLYHNGSYTFRTEADGARVVNASDNNDGTLFLGNTYGYIKNDMNSQVSIYNGSNDAVIIGTHNSYTYLYFNGYASARTLSGGLQVFSNSNNDDGYLYIGDNGTTYIQNDEDSGFGILNSNDWVLWNDNNAHTYLYYNGSYTMRTLSDGIQINNTAYANSNLAWNYNGSTHHTLTSNNSNNPHMKGSATGSAGLLITDSAGNSPTQLYASTAGYGFLASAWGNWDIQKVPTGNLYLNNNTSYYLNPVSWSTVYDFRINRNLSMNGNMGNAGQVLQSNGTNATPTWVDAGGGAWSLVSKSTISNANTVNYTVSAGVWYRFIMWGVTMASSQLRLALQLSSDGGSSMAYWCHTSFEIYNSSASTSNVITEHAYIDHIKLTEQYLKLANTGNGVNYNGNVFEVNYYQPTSGSGEECRVWGYAHGYGTQRRREFFRCHVINTQNNINYLRFVNENKTTASAWNLYGQWNLYKMEP